MIAIFQAAERTGCRPSARAVIAFGRSLDLHFTNGEGYGWLRPFAEAAVLRNAPRSTSERTIEEGGAAGSTEPLRGAPSRRAVIDLVSNSGGSHAGARDGETLEERSLALAAKAFDAILDAELSDPDYAKPEPWIRANEEAARRLVHKHGEELVLERWCKSLDDAKVGHLKRHDFSLAFLIRIWDKCAPRPSKHSAAPAHDDYATKLAARGM